MLNQFIALMLCITLLLASAPSAYGLLLVKPGFDLDDDPVIAAEIIAVVNEVAIDHPAVRGVVISTEELPYGIYAYAVDDKIAFNDQYTSDPSEIRVMVDTDAKTGFHPPLGRCTGPQMLAYHEAAHVIDRRGGRAARNQLAEKYGAGRHMRGKLSRYSFTLLGTLAPGEAIAEAFAAVKCNGGNKHEKEIYQLLLDAA